MTESVLAAYLLAAMTTWMPPQQHREGERAARDRYASIAKDIADVALDETEAPVFPGANGRTETALLLASIASYESGFRADIDDGRVRGSHGRAWCLMQVVVFDRTQEGWRGKDLVADRRNCITAGLHLARASFEACASLPLEDRLSVYTIGQCRTEPFAEWRTRRALRWFKRHDPPVEDGALRTSLRDPGPWVEAMAE